MIDPILLCAITAGIAGVAVAVYLSATRSRLVEQLKSRERAVEEQMQVIRDLQEVRKGLIEEVARSVHERDQAIVLADGRQDALNCLNEEVLHLQGEQDVLAQRHAESISRIAELERQSSSLNNQLYEKERLLKQGAIESAKFRLAVKGDLAKLGDAQKSAEASELAREGLEREAEKLRGEVRALGEKLEAATLSLEEMCRQADELRADRLLPEKLQRLKEEVAHFENTFELYAAGLYEVQLDYGTPSELQSRLNEIRTQLADLIRTGDAVKCSAKWTVNGSSAEGTRATKHYIRIMLRTFNADVEACLGKVRWNNLVTMKERVAKSFQYVNELGSSHATSIQPAYIELRLLQLEKMHQYRESVYRAKEAMRAARVRAREEARANREIELARAEAELEEQRYAAALLRAKQELPTVIGHERQQMVERIAQLELSLARASEQKQRAISMAQITKAGFVYIVSNIGSFGPDVLKIGMTRRIDPNERVRELGGASVPFPFDVHAMIYSENAPELENTFHRHFGRRRLNLANGRKEFFRVSIDEVQDLATSLNYQLEFCRDAEAKDFRMSLEIRERVLPSMTDAELAQVIADSALKEEYVDPDEAVEDVE